MAVTRLGHVRLAAQTEYGFGDQIFGASGADYLMSVIITNMEATEGHAHVYVVPAGWEANTEWALVVYNLPISGYNTYETFRFAVNDTDTVWVAGSAGLDFYAQGVEQLPTP